MRSLVLCLALALCGGVSGLVVSTPVRSVVASTQAVRSIGAPVMTSANKKAKAAVRKAKSSRAATKRFKATSTGKLLRHKAFRSHILTKKHPLRKMGLRRTEQVHESELKTYQKLLLVTPKKK